MSHVNRTIHALKPLVSNAIRQEAGVRSATNALKVAAHNVERTLAKQHPQEFEKIMAGLRKEIEQSTGRKLASEVGKRGGKKAFDSEAMAKEVMREFIKSEISDAVKEELKPDNESVSLLLKTLGLRSRQNFIEIRKHLHDVHTAKQKKDSVPPTKPARETIAEIHKIDPQILSDLVQFFNSRIAELTVAVAAGINDPRDLIYLNQEISEIEQDRDQFFSLLESPMQFCAFGKKVLAKLSGEVQNKEGYDPNKERKTHLFRGVSPKIKEEATRLQERLDKISISFK